MLVFLFQILLKKDIGNQTTFIKVFFFSLLPNIKNTMIMVLNKKEMKMIVFFFNHSFPHYLMFPYIIFFFKEKNRRNNETIFLEGASH